MAIVKFEEFGELLTPVEAMKLLGVGHSKIYALLRAGDIKHVRIGKSIKIPKQCLIEYIENMISGS
jgi:excisionase family DNA binding protein